MSTIKIQRYSDPLVAEAIMRSLVSGHGWCLLYISHISCGSHGIALTMSVPPLLLTCSRESHWQIGCHKLWPPAGWVLSYRLWRQMHNLAGLDQSQEIFCTSLFTVYRSAMNLSPTNNISLYSIIEITSCFFSFSYTFFTIKNVWVSFYI